jgi:hypothetical protein
LEPKMEPRAKVRPSTSRTQNKVSLSSRVHRTYVIQRCALRSVPQRWTVR